MDLLWRHLKVHWRLVFLALLLAAINQIFSLLDPWIFRLIIDGYATKFHSYTTSQFIHGVSLLLGAAVGVAFVSRVAKNFQDYFVNVITQRTGAALYAEGVEHSLSLPYGVFEDQRSGETLGKLQKVRSDVERFITAFVNILFTSTVGIIFVTIYALRVDWVIAPAFFLTIPLLGGMSSVLSRKIKTIQKVIVAETTALAGSTTESLRNIELVKTLGLARQEVGRLNATTDKILKLELKKVRYLRSLSFIQGTMVNLLRTSILFLMLYLIFTQRITVGQFFSLFIYSFFIFGPLQELGNIINIYRETEASLNKLEEILAIAARAGAGQPGATGEAGSTRLRRRDVHASDRQPAGAVPRQLPGVARRNHRVRRPIRGRQDNAGEAAGRAVSAAARQHALQRHCCGPDRAGKAARTDRLRHPGHAAVFRHHSREPAVRPAGRHGCGMPGSAAASGCAIRCWRGPTRASTR